MVSNFFHTLVLHTPTWLIPAANVALCCTGCVFKHRQKYKTCKSLQEQRCFTHSEGTSTRTKSGVTHGWFWYQFYSHLSLAATRQNTQFVVLSLLKLMGNLRNIRENQNSPAVEGSPLPFLLSSGSEISSVHLIIASPGTAKIHSESWLVFRLLRDFATAVTKISSCWVCCLPEAPELVNLSFSGPDAQDASRQGRTAKAQSVLDACNFSPQRSCVT